MFKDHVISQVTEAGSEGVEQTQLFTDFRSQQAAISLTNTLAQMRRDGEVVLRREVRDGERVGIYYLPEHAPTPPAQPTPPAPSE